MYSGRPATTYPPASAKRARTTSVSGTMCSLFGGATDCAPTHARTDGNAFPARLAGSAASLAPTPRPRSRRRRSPRSSCIFEQFHGALAFSSVEAIRLRLDTDFLTIPVSLNASWNVTPGHALICCAIIMLFIEFMKDILLNSLHLGSSREVVIQGLCGPELRR